MPRSTGSLSICVLLAVTVLLPSAVTPLQAADQQTQPSAAQAPQAKEPGLLFTLPEGPALRAMPSSSAASPRASLRLAMRPTIDLTGPLTALATAAADKSPSAGTRPDSSPAPTSSGPQLFAPSSSGSDKTKASAGVKVDGPVVDVDTPRATVKSSATSSPSKETPGSDKAKPIQTETPKTPAPAAPAAKLEKQPAKTSGANVPSQKPPQKKHESLELETPLPTPKAPLSETMVAVRDRVRWVLANYFQQTFSTSENNCADILHVCMAFGCQTEVQNGNDKVNGITALCWNYPCGGYELLKEVDRHLGPRVGYGYQEQPGQFLAMLAISRVPANYPIRFGEDVRTLADIVEHEKLNCRQNDDQSLRLVGIANYAIDGRSWNNDIGERWSVDRMVKEELAQPAKHGDFGGTQRLLALSYALARQTTLNAELRNETEKYLKEFRAFAYRLQNSDGSWHPLYFAATGTNNDSISQLRATAHVLQWLAVSQPEQALDAPELIRAVEYVNSYLISQNGRWNVATQNAQTIDAVTCALSALTLYDERAFKPYDHEPAKQKPAAQPTEEKTAQQ